MTQITLQTGPERRRHWSAAAQREILSAAFMPRAVVTEVGRRYDVSTSLIYKWRQQAQGRSDVAFVPAVLLPEPMTASAPPTSPAIVVELTGGTRLTIDAQASAALVGAVLRALR
ncbi:IS66-like element accessory protein TnpA [Lichenifustis flavocetrariae]|uniref:Transposase n=1 Tax=Lichenifustis flavocetrariae TaxID=2949735 RepID=A0AA42CMN0_9HYPH|nr:transposase [Lichenifustis flavocetrariae]MCW6512859.1 transposase [Lichenifustis flavocetrariae]